jgi:hypothetical protein
MAVAGVLVTDCGWVAVAGRVDGGTVEFGECDAGAAEWRVATGTGDGTGIGAARFGGRPAGIVGKR